MTRKHARGDERIRTFKKYYRVRAHWDDARIVHGTYSILMRPVQHEILLRTNSQDNGRLDHVVGAYIIFITYVFMRNERG